MRHITGRAVRTAIGTVAALATLALPLVLGTAHTAPSDGTSSVRAIELDSLDPTYPNPEKPGDDTGSWVWDTWD
ncbi:hypothetical protein [Streptomyces sp. NPDC002845]